MRISDWSSDVCSSGLSFVAVEAPLPADGTYRITTGERSGRSVKMAKIDGSWLAVRQPRPGQPRSGQAPRPARQGEDGRPRAIDEIGRAPRRSRACQYV